MDCLQLFLNKGPPQRSAIPPDLELLCEFHPNFEWHPILKPRKAEEAIDKRLKAMVGQ